MSQECNSETYSAISQQIKSLKTLCLNSCGLIENNGPNELRSITSENVVEKSLNYVEELRKNIEDTETPITYDENLVTSQFLSEMKKKTRQVEELTAYTMGVIGDIDRENDRLSTQIKIVKNAKKQQKSPSVTESSYVLKAKENFRRMKAELVSLLQTLFPKEFEDMKTVLGQLMEVALNEGDGKSYIPVTTENFNVIELLYDMHIITYNPYNKAEVKLSYK